jgi:hypothetical protein
MSTTSQNTSAKKTTTRRAPAKKAAPKVEAEVETETTESAPVESAPDVVDEPTDDVVVADEADEADDYSYTVAALRKHGIDPDGIPTYNAFFDNGYIRIRGSREFGIVTDFTPWPSQAVRNEVTEAYRKDRS